MGPAPRAFLVLASLLVAGCSGDAKPPTEGTATTSGSSAAPVANDPGAAPVWAVGDWWTYSIQYPNSGDSVTATVVVHQEDGNAWHLATGDRKSGELAEFSHYPTLGAWTKRDLQPTIHGALIPFLKFPLTDGKTWSDPYRGVPATWKATRTGDAFELEAAIQDGQTVKYGYDRAVGFLTHLEYGFGAPNTIMTLVASGRNFTGSVSVLTFTEHVHGSYPVAPVPPPTQPPGGAPQNPTTSFNVAGGKPLLWGFYYGGAPGTYEFSLHPQQGSESQGVEHHPQTTDSAARFLWGEIAEPNAGSWGLLCSGVSQGAGFVFAEALEVHEEIRTLA